jgi:hypothetical protein
MPRKKYTLSRALTKYEQDINSLIPIAEKEAKAKAKEFGKLNELKPGVDGRTYFHCFFSEFFHQAMNRLAFESGFRSL